MGDETALIRQPLAQIGDASGAVEKLAAMVADLLGQGFAPVLPTSEGDAAVIRDWLRSGRRGESRKTQTEYLRDLCGPAFGFLAFVASKPIAMVTRQDFTDYKEHLAALIVGASDKREAHPLSIATQCRILASIKGLLTHTNAIGYAPYNPGKGVVLPSLPKSKRDKALSQSQAIKMLTAAERRADDTETDKRKATRHRDFLLNKMFYMTGGRLSEMLGLRWSDIYATDKGGECRILRGKGNKERVVNLPAELYDALMVMRAAASEDGFVFRSQKGGKLGLSQGLRIVKAVAAEAKISKRVTPHTWRHSIATQLLDAGAPLHQVSNFLGHSDPKITVANYYHPAAGLDVTEYIKQD